MSAVGGIMDRDLIESVYRGVYAGKLDAVISDLVNRLGDTDDTPFKEARRSTFNMTPAQVHGWLQEMASALSEETALAFMYVEMNGFDINYDRWFCDAFGYSREIEITDPFEDGTETDDALSGVDAELHWNRALTLTGMELMQEAFRWWNEETDSSGGYSYASDVGGLLVQCRFLSLMKDGRAAGALSPDVPIAAATHDSDLIVKFDFR